MILENAPPALRGQLSRFMLEPFPGVFVGDISGLVRDQLWQYCLRKVPELRMIQIWSDANEQGFSLRVNGETRRKIIEWEGLYLVAIPDTSHQKRVEALKRLNQ